ncbi:MAG: hypothetical protein NTY47_00865, partial [Candidatus Omnitrophica bacterium]|nr:hypothetical protein [Candidatus Omnitrophota bacterium]
TPADRTSFTTEDTKITSITPADRTSFTTEDTKITSITPADPTSFTAGDTNIASITPADRTSFTAGDTINISCQTNTPNRIVQNSLIQYRFSLDAKVLKDWSTVSSYSYKTTSQDLNRHTIKVEAKDERNNTDTKSSDVFVFVAFPKPSN